MLAPLLKRHLGFPDAGVRLFTEPTAPLVAALRGLGVGALAVPALSPEYTLDTVMFSQVKAVPVDVDSRTGCLTVKLLEQTTTLFDAVFAPCRGGVAPDLVTLSDYCRCTGKALIVDATEVVGSSLDYSLADAVCFRFPRRFGTLVTAGEWELPRCFGCELDHQLESVAQEDVLNYADRLCSLAEVAATFEGALPKFMPCVRRYPEARSVVTFLLTNPHFSISFREVLSQEGVPWSVPNPLWELPSAIDFVRRCVDISIAELTPETAQIVVSLFSKI